MTTQEWVTDMIREGILNGYFKDGEPIPSAELADKLGVSRTPIRIALSQLESEGLVSIKPHKSAVAVKLSPEEVMQIYDIRYEVEGLAVQLAVKEITDKQVTELVTIVNEMDKTTDSEKYMKLNNKFHATIYSLSNNEVLINLINQLMNKIKKYLKLYLSQQINIDEANKQHKEILKAIKNRDTVKARNAVRDHLSTTCNTVVNNLKRL